MVVVGAGAVGTSAAYHLAQGGLDVLVLEKESDPGRHQSSRNSGVIHAGYNLQPGSAKARYCHDGNHRLRAYCQDRGITMHQGGILVVAKQEADVATVKELKRRADANDVEARVVDSAGLQEIEPQARGVAALHAPEGASFDAAGFVQALQDDAVSAGARFQYGATVTGHNEEGGVTVQVDGHTVKARAMLNAAGLHADRIAGTVAPDLRVVPFRGYYAELAAPARRLVRSHIYAAPDLDFPFLGVHLSRRFDDRVIVGPGAMLAFGREAYRFWQVQPRDLKDTLSWPGFWRLFRKKRFRGLVASEVQKSLSLRAVHKEAKGLVPALRAGDLQRSFAGNRAQVVDRSGALVQDMLVRETEHCVHVLNAVSPGLTCSLPFGEDLAKQVAAMM